MSGVRKSSSDSAVSPKAGSVTEHYYTRERVLYILNLRVEEAGGPEAFAHLHGLDTSSVRDAHLWEEVSPKLLTALGLKSLIVYERIES